ncbi:hypothetical protein [Actinophytocola sediminis]
MRLAAVPGVTPVPVGSVDQTARALADLMVQRRGQDFAHDPGIAIAARDAAELALAGGAGLVAVVNHQQADPATLVGQVLTTDNPLGDPDGDELAAHLSAGAELREVTRSRTERGYPVVLAERLLLAGCQLQAVVIDPSGRRLAVFTLHSTTGRGWLELAAVLGHLVSSVDFEVVPAHR